MTLFLFFIVPAIGQEPISVNLDDLTFSISTPGYSFTQDRFIPPEEVDLSLNYFLHTAFWAGARNGDILSVVSGDGNPTVKEFTEWKFETPVYQINDITQDTSLFTVYRSVFSDNTPLPGLGLQ